jgi:FkbH-like protein
MSIYKISSNVRTIILNDRSVWAGHPFFGNFVLTGDYARVLLSLAEQPRSVQDLHDALQLPLDQIRKAVTFIAFQHFILKQEQDEDDFIQETARRLSRLGRNTDEVAHFNKLFRDYAPLTPPTSSAQNSHRDPLPVNFLIVGGCLTNIASDALVRLAPDFGLQVQTAETFPGMIESTLMDEPDVVVFQPSVANFLGSLWSDAPSLSDAQGAARLETMKEELQRSIRSVRASAPRALLLVHGFSTPTYSPLGRMEFRRPYHFYRIVYELNQVVIEALQTDPNGMLVDEERLLSAVGKLRLMDHAVSTFRHHGPIDLVADDDPHGAARAATFGVLQPCHAPELFARAYLESFLIWKGIDRIKCVIVDLDNTLWPGLATDDDFNLEERFTVLNIGTFAGIHEALKVVKQRGVLLAVSSRNDEEAVGKAWAQLASLINTWGSVHLLQPEDFVLQKIDWRPKSVNVGEIMTALGLSPQSVLFIDDSAVEREEVQTAYPAIRVLGADMNQVRSALLDNPRLQTNQLTDEAAARTEMVKGQLLRDAFKNDVKDEFEFLRKLNVRLQVSRLQGQAHIARVVELLQRTNQFNTTLLRLDVADVRRYVAGTDSAVYMLRAADRFTNYGLVGVCIIEGSEIVAFVLSCRVIPLCAEMPFLITAIVQYGRAPLLGKIVEGPRNQPCRRVYKDAGFDELEPGQYALRSLTALPQVDAGVYQVEYEEEALCDTGAQQGPQRLSSTEIG